MLEALRAAVAVGWANAQLAGAVSLDDAATAAADATRCPVLIGVPGTADPTSWPVALGRLREEGTSAYALAAPAAGDPVGLAGPVEFTARAVAAGAAVLASAGRSAYGLVAVADGAGRRWQVEPVNVPPAPPGVGEAGWAMAEAVRAGTEELERLDVARASPAAARARAGVEAELSRHPLPPTTSARAAALLVSAARLLEAMASAGQDDGGAVSSAEARRRLLALAPVAAAARRALVAAASEPPSR